MQTMNEMAWERIEISEDERRACKKAFSGTARFLVDEDIDLELANVLSSLGYNSTSVKDSGLAGRSDEDILAFAKLQTS